ncbi:MAG: DUF547 domain-containing protein [Nitrospina sp.]|nr:MAG: DUF547 domain-containing protein [Nitrospina sp.]
MFMSASRKRSMNFKSKTIFQGILIIMITLVLNGTPAAAQAFDFSGWDALLKKHVRPTTLEGVRLNALDYARVRTDPEFKKIVSALKSFSPARLKTRDEKLAFWINVYNIMAVKMVLDHYPVKGIKDAGSLFQSVWEQPAGQVGGKKISLNDIEHKILRKMDEPRMHVAIVCASVSCPDLRREAYRAETLDVQLTDQTQRFLQNWGKGMRLDSEENRLYLSKIFSWFEGDFETQGGVLEFITTYAPASIQKDLKRGKLKISYLDYNWNLNTL